MSEGNRPASKASEASFPSTERPTSSESNPPNVPFGAWAYQVARDQGRITGDEISVPAAPGDSSEFAGGPSSGQPGAKRGHKRERTQENLTREVKKFKHELQQWSEGSVALDEDEIDTWSPGEFFMNTNHYFYKTKGLLECWRNTLSDEFAETYFKSEGLQTEVQKMATKYKEVTAVVELSASLRNANWEQEVLREIRPRDFHDQLKNFYDLLYDFVEERGGRKAGLTRRGRRRTPSESSETGEIRETDETGWTDEDYEKKIQETVGLLSPGIKELQKTFYPYVKKLGEKLDKSKSLLPPEGNLAGDREQPFLTRNDLDRAARLATPDSTGGLAGGSPPFTPSP